VRREKLLKLRVLSELGGKTLQLPHSTPENQKKKSLHQTEADSQNL
jgi:hypothetical protein